MIKHIYHINCNSDDIVSLIVNILTCLSILFFPCEFVSSKRSTIGLTIQNNQHLSVEKRQTRYASIRTNVYALSFSKLHSLYKSCLDTAVTEFNYVQTYSSRHVYCQSQVHKLLFANKGLEAINLTNILHQKSVKYKIPPILKITLY